MEHSCDSPTATCWIPYRKILWGSYCYAFWSRTPNVFDFHWLRKTIRSYQSQKYGVPLTITCFILLGLCMHSFVFVQSYNHTRMYATTATDPYQNQRDFGRLSTITTSSSPPALWYANMLNYLAEYFCLIGRFTVISGEIESWKMRQKVVPRAT